MKVNIRCSNGDIFAVNDVDPNQTVGEFKEVIATQSNIPAADQRLIYRGKVLKDQASLKSYGVEDGLTVHLVRGKPQTATTTTSSTTTPTTTTPTPSTTTPTSTTTTSTPSVNTSTTNDNTNNQQQPNPFNMFGGGNNNNLFGNMGMGGLPSMDPNTMQQMMNNPMVQGMLNNPDFIREVMGSNPQIQEIMRNNPEVGRMLQDPDMIRRAMEMSRNPELMREMMRNTDLALSNIENLPGGFDALRRMYSDVQEPLHEATSEMLRPPQSTTSPTTTPTQTTNTNAPTGQPFNMWGNNQPPTNTNTTNTTTQGTNQNTNPFSMFGNMGMGGNMGGMNPQQASQMMQNPLMQQMMQTMLSDPQMMDQLIGSNPMLQQMTQQNPMLRNMLSNPQFIQQVMQLQGLMNNQQQPTTGTNTTGNTTGNPFDSLQQMMQGMNLGNGAQGTQPNPFAMFGNPFMGGGFGGQPNTQQTPTQPPRERFATQLSQLQEMGFFDEQSNLEALLISNGNVNAAIEYLLSNPPPRRN